MSNRLVHKEYVSQSSCRLFCHFFYFRYKDNCAEKKRDIEQDFRSQLAGTKNSAIVTNLLFSETLNKVTVDLF